MKDPAFLFYYQDWLVGTAFLTRKEKGAYMDLLCYQADKGTLTLDTIKNILNGDFDCWGRIKDKFIEEDGSFYNLRLKNEKEKRVKFSESRRSNRKGAEQPSLEVITPGITFEDFWNLYDKKLKKDKAEAKWNTISDSEKQKIMTLLPAYVASFKDKQFQPYPTTYLNERRWLDEIYTPKTNTEKAIDKLKNL